MISNVALARKCYGAVNEINPTFELCMEGNTKLIM